MSVRKLAALDTVLVPFAVAALAMVQARRGR